jgi:hypothetical protein
MKYDSNHQILFNLNDDSECRDAFDSLRAETLIGQRYAAEFYDGDKDNKNRNKILRAVAMLFNLDDDHASLSQLATALESVIRSGRIRPLEEEDEEILEAPVVDTTPRGKDGKPLSSSQLAWKEFREWSESHTSIECKARARSEEAYGKFYRTNLTREFAAEQVGDAVSPAGQVAHTTQATQQLIQFVKDYNREPVTNLKPRAGFVTLAGEQMSWQLFQETLTKASAAGLL